MTGRRDRQGSVRELVLLALAGLTAVFANGAVVRDGRRGMRRSRLGLIPEELSKALLKVLVLFVVLLFVLAWVRAKFP
jgi:hypothetical protein